MSVSIILCPSCNSLLLPDTAQCPSCHHVLIEGSARPAELGTLPQQDSNEVEDACPGCNELVRRGLVRCWNCGTFMREEIAQTYQRMQATPPKVIYSELPEETDDTVDEPAAVSAPQVDDVDFELAPGGGAFELADDDDFDTAAPLAAREDAIVAAAPTYSLQTPVAPTEPVPEAKPAKESPTKAPESKKPDAPAKTDAPAKPAGDAPHDFVSEFESQFGSQHHSIATGGDVLLQVALAEEAEGVRKKRGAGSGGRGGFVVYCPHGHRVEVQERHRGLTGRCPRCREPFVVPAISFDTEKADAEAQAQKAAQIAADAAAEQATESEISAGEYTRWMTDQHFHSVNLTKLKLKAGSLLTEFTDVELAFSPNGMLLITLAKKGGLFGGGNDKKKLAVRQAVIQHLTEGKEHDTLPGAARQFYDVKALTQIRIVQPIASADESMFAGVAVFGDGRIALRLPKVDEAPDPQFLSFTLSEYRKFAEILEEFYGIKKAGDEVGIPLEDILVECVCHSSQEHLSCLEHIEFYQNDPTFKLKLIGRKCQACGIVMSEETRTNDKFGGKNGKSIAKAKCPKCEKPFGDISLYRFDDTPPPAPPEAAPVKK